MVIDTNNIQDDYKEQYLVQSVANLGQRLGVKGDSVISNSFSFRDLFDEVQNTEMYTSDTHIGCIQRKHGGMYIGVYPKSSLVSATSLDNLVEISIPNSNNAFINNAIFEIGIEETKIKFFSAGSIIAARSSNYVFCGIGNDEDNKPSQFVYEEFRRSNSSANAIVNALKLMNINGLNVVLTMSTMNNSAKITIYEMPKGDTVLDGLLTSLDAKLHEINGDVYNSSTDDYDNYGIPNEAKINKLSVSYWINYLKAYKYSTNLQNVEFILNNDGQIDWDSSAESLAKFAKYDGIKDVLTRLTVYDTSMLDDIKRIYSQKLYASSNDDFKHQILCSLFNGIYVNNPLKAVLYVPIDFKFNYYCNSNDNWKIYGSIDDINVRFVNKSITPYNLSGYYAENQLLANISGENRSALYNFNVEYDENYDDLVYCVNVNKLFTLPYVNNDNYWVVNDNITNVNAKGKDAGNPNIIIIYNYNKTNNDGSFKILHSANKEQLLTNVSTLKWENVVTCVPPIDKINIDNLEDSTILTKNDLLKIYCHIPKLTNEESELVNLLKYSLIINISSVDCFVGLNEKIIDKYGINGTVTTFWTFNEETLTYDTICNPEYNPDDFGIVSMDFTAIANLNNLVKWHLENAKYKNPDKFLHKWLVFENANYETKHSVNDNQSYIYPIIANKQAFEYNINDYSNNLNLYVKFNDRVSGGEADNITSIGNSNYRYLYSSSLNVTNSLYYKTDGLKHIKYNEYIPSSNIPSLHLSEVITHDANFSNRLNIISFNKKGNMYYSYVGTSFNDSDKSRMHIGSSELNINLGKETLINNEKRNLFSKSKELSIDFDNTFVNGYAYIAKDINITDDSNVEHLNWTIAKHIDKTVFKTNYIPESKLIECEDKRIGALFDYPHPIQFNNTKLIKFNSTSNSEIFINGQIKRYANMASKFASTSTLSDNDYRLWIPTFYVFDKNYLSGSKIIYNGEALYLPALLCKLRLKKYANQLNKVEVKSNMDVVTYDGYPVMMLTSNRFIEGVNYSVINNEIDTASWQFLLEQIYTGNSLDISYYESDTRLYLTINETTNRQKINNLFKIQLNY